MADFRKWFLAFAALAIVSSVAVPANAQITSALQCVANAGVPPTVRAEGLTELVGDLVLNCTGGIPTLPNNLVPQANVTIFLSTNITSRLIDSTTSTSEALLLIDEPHSTSNPGTPLSYCNSAGYGTTTCAVLGAPNGNGVGTYSGTVSRPNVFVGRQTGNNQVTFFGVPIDPPGTVGTRIIRITNIRGNANQLGVSSTLVPTQITAYVSITGSTSVPVNNPQQTVAFVQKGLTFGRYSTGMGTNVAFVQCTSQSSSTYADNSKAFSTGQFNQVGVRFTEGFGSAWKVRNISETLAAGFTNGSANTAWVNNWAQGADLNQNVPGAIYNTETGFLNANADPLQNPPGYTGPNLNASGDGNITAAIGSATQGTRLMISLASVPNGVTVFAPTFLPLTNQISSGTTTGWARLVSTDGSGGGAFSATSATNGAAAPVTVSSTGAGIIVYEIVQSDPFAIEVLSVPLSVVYTANVGSNLPQPGVTATAGGSFAPLSSVGTASASAPIPRFAPGDPAQNLFNVVKCSCNILFPFVTNQQGYDTGIAISNTTLDSLNTAIITPQQGLVTLSYYGGSTPPSPQTTNAVVPAGAQVLFTLSGGGNYGIAATPGFQGYIIAQAQFQYCHAFAYISAQGALPTAPGASESYLGLILDAPGLYRTLQAGENLAH